VINDAYNISSNRHGIFTGRPKALPGGLQTTGVPKAQRRKKGNRKKSQKQLRTRRWSSEAASLVPTKILIWIWTTHSLVSVLLRRGEGLESTGVTWTYDRSNVPTDWQVFHWVGMNSSTSCIHNGVRFHETHSSNCGSSIWLPAAWSTIASIFF